MRTIRRRAVLAALLAPAAPACVAQDVPTVAAASDLRYALDEIAANFRQQTGRALRISYGSSGNFFQQITRAAPFELFFSADEDYILRLARDGLAIGQGAPYAVGRVVLFLPKDSPLQASRLADLAAPLAAGRIQRFAIANPQHAPYGRAAVESLQSAGLWPAIEPKLVYGENVSQAALMATSGATDAGIFALSLAKAPQIAGRGSFVVIPQGMHRPLVQRMALLKGARQTARDFYAYVQTPPARAVLVKFGFQLPTGN